MSRTTFGSRLSSILGPNVPLLLAATIMPNFAGATCPAWADSNIDSGIRSPEKTSDFVIREIYIANGDVFDIENPDHAGFVHKLMNRLHIQTKEEVIRRQLLFSEGDVVGEGALSETERYLRLNRYLADAEVLRKNCTERFVDVHVKTTDAWSLIPSISFSRKGGQNFGGVDIQETNLFGSGSELKLAYDSDIERDLLGLRYADRQLGDSRTGILIALEDYDVGYRYQFDLVQPFYSLNAHRAAGIRMGTFDQVDGVFELGERISDVRHSGNQFVGHFGWSQGVKKGRVIRWTAGVGYDQHEFEPDGDLTVPWPVPSDRRDVYPFLGMELVEDSYEKVRNQDQISRIEDRHIGTRLSMQLGYAPQVLGSLDNALRVDLAASRGFHPVAGDLVMLRSELQWRRPRAGRASHLFQADARYYHQRSENQLFYAQLRAAGGNNLDTDRQLYLGGGTGLRAYPVRYLNGDKSAILTLEHRLYTDWYPFGLFRIGAAAFMDMGKVWGDSDKGATVSGILRDAGVGLRIGSPHSTTGRMLHIDAAYALDGPSIVRGWQLYIESRTSF